MSGHRVIFSWGFLPQSWLFFRYSYLKDNHLGCLVQILSFDWIWLDISQYIVFKVHGYTIVRSAARLASRSRASPYKIWKSCLLTCEHDAATLSKFCTSHCLRVNGDGEIRTLDPLLARQVLSQLSYTPTKGTLFVSFRLVRVFPSSHWVLKNPMGLSGHYLL